MTEKNYSLLRPFDLEAAKAGALMFCINPPGRESECVFVAKAGDEVCIRFETFGFSIYSEKGAIDSFRTPPLYWVEGKPVYPDTPMEREDNGWPVAWSVDGSAWLDDAGNWSDERDGFKIQWPRPKPVKRWINIYNIGYASKDEADKGAAGGRIACVEIELPPLPAK